MKVHLVTNKTILMILVLSPSLLVVYCRRCAEPNSFPAIGFQDYIDIVLQQSNSGRQGFAASVNLTEIHVSSSDTGLPGHGRHGSNLGRTRTVHGGGNSINTLSECPWTYYVSNVRDRKPKRLTQAVCSNNVSENGYICAPLVRYIAVFRRNGCFDRVWQYSMVWEPIVTACVAINRPDTVYNGNTRIVSPY